MADTITLSGGSSSTGVGAPKHSVGWATNTRLYFRQAKSSTAGKFKLQVRLYVFYTSYDSTQTASLQIYTGSSTSGTKLLDKSWTWSRSTAGDHMYYSSWYTLSECSNVSSQNIYAVCNPGSGSFNDTLTIKGIKRSYSLTVSSNNIQSYSYSIIDNSKINAEDRNNQTAESAIVYDSDVIQWTATARNGYKIDPSSGTITVSGNNVILNLIASARATIHKFMNGAWQLYSIYVRRDGNWVLHQANIRKDGTWQQYT